MQRFINTISAAADWWSGTESPDFFWAESPETFGAARGPAVPQTVDEAARFIATQASNNARASVAQLMELTGLSWAQAIEVLRAFRPNWSDLASEAFAGFGNGYACLLRTSKEEALKLLQEAPYRDYRVAAASGLQCGLNRLRRILESESAPTGDDMVRLGWAEDFLPGWHGPDGRYAFRAACAQKWGAGWATGEYR